MITNMIELRVGKLTLNHLIGINCPEFRNELLDSYVFKLNLGSDCLELCFWTVTFKTIFDSVILQKYQSLLNQSFKHNSTHMPFLYKKLGPGLSSESYLYFQGFRRSKLLNGCLVV